ncbi:LCP family protein [Nocardioides sp. zg-DK7169]|uniref:LCP family protein n=1 Tax=Nocardioides sp. zg-DK7169 TaxID=2736600 RepID=UPI00155383D0|nr:LCP family protein [Nocardioides sp. zg-DK7169]NPC97376.1 LCP family protein [Nocardioides sp. zg-DK7169]
MTEEQPPAAPSDVAAPAGRRKAKPQRRHTVAKVIVSMILTLGMVSALGTIWLYRDLTDNMTVEDLTDQLGDRPDKAVDDGPQEPLNILVMGSDDRDGAGNNIDGLTGGGQRSDTTLLFHLSGDRSHAYGVSIPRDSLVTRPDCIAEDGSVIPGKENAMWNDAFALGGPACTIHQFEELTDVLVDHYVVVDFAGFKDMVDAIDGVPVCVPEDIDDPKHGIFIEAGTRDLSGDDALNYVRARYTLGDGSDIGRVKRQQAFVAAMANKVVSGGVLARPDRLIGFLQAATKSLTVDPGLSNPLKISKVGLGFQDIGLSNIRFITVPWAYDTREEFRGRVVWTDAAATVWKRVRDDEQISRRLDSGAINAATVPGAGGSGSGSGDGDGGDSTSPSPSDDPDTAARDEAQREALESAGLCV